MDGAVTVVTDSTSYLPAELVEERGITRVSLYYKVDGAPLERELDLDSLGDFYEALAASDEPAATSPPTVEDFAAAYEPLLSNGGSVVSTHISSGLSETCANARAAAQRLADAGKGGERIKVVDAATTAGSLGLVALAANAAARTGELEATAARAAEARQHTQTRFFVDTLDYLRRGGRIGTAAAWMGSALEIKPILALESEIRAVERVRTRDRAVERLIEWARRQHSAGSDAWAVHHAHAADEAAAFAGRLQEIFRRPPEFIAELGPVIGTHTGPGMLAVAVIPSRFLG